MKKRSAKKKAGAAKKRGVGKKAAAKKKSGGKKKEGAVKEGGAALSGGLKSLTEGLSYQSESDYAVEPYARGAAEGAPSAGEFAKGKEGEDAAVRELDFDSFFDNYTDEQDWWGEQERAVAGKFQALVRFLKENLSDVKVYRVGGVEADVYVVGRTASGEYAGVKTKVVET
jgi:hypothetical protein